ncbi:hypothetical protein BYT27DRAFT_6700301 [Phlegmacium glaucopus]|nr:hypothetical protein BYT27DRAFT_6700301 [Phlegmacium glaucopus]
MTFLTGRIKHECNLRPTFIQNYRHQMRERHKKYKEVWLTGSEVVSASALGPLLAISIVSSSDSWIYMYIFLIHMIRKRNRNKLTAHSSVWLVYYAIGFSTNCLLCFVKPHWVIRPLREKIQQPEAYLKEVLAEITFLHRV